MNELSAKECVPCKGGVPPLKGTALVGLQNKLGGNWRVINEHHLESAGDPEIQTRISAYELAYRMQTSAPDLIDIVVHPQSIIHGMVTYRDGSVLAHLGSPDMRTPIAYALGWPDRTPAPTKRLDLAEVGRLTFEAPDDIRFPALRIAREALTRAGAPTVLNAANETAVHAFLAGEIGFLEIAATVERTLELLLTLTGSSFANFTVTNLIGNLDATAVAGTGQRLVHLHVVQAMRIEPAEGIVREEKRAAILEAQRKPDPIIFAVVPEMIALRPAVVIDGCVYGITWGRGRHDIGDQAFIPAVYRKIHIEVIRGAPVPVQEFVVALAMPVPVGHRPHFRHTVLKIFFQGAAALEIFSGAEQAHEQVGGLHDICSVVQPSERDGLARGAVHKMRIDAVIAVGLS